MSRNFSSRSNYLPLNKHDLDKTTKVACTIPFGVLAWATVSLPFLAFIFCVVWSVVYDFETTVSTHCKVDNFLPSISAAIGNESPQREVWQFFIALHAPTRFLVVWMYRRYYWSVLRRNILWLAGLNCVLSVIENTALLGLTFVSSSLNYPIHEKCFITFIATSEIYMIVCCYLLRYRRSLPATKIEDRALSLKSKLLCTNILSFFIAAYFFVRHNAYCEPYVYSLFALFEYIVVLTNMGFHMTAYYDLYDRQLHLGVANSWIS